MSSYFGVLFALGALFAWGLGDFLIQRTTRAVGSFKALFFIGIVGMVGLFPLIKNDLAHLDTAAWLLLGSLGFVVIFAALFDFEALKQGKIAIVEPLIGLELPLTVGLTVGLGRDNITLVQGLLMAVIFIGIVLAVTAHHTHLHYHKRIFERGVAFAGLGAIGMALVNYLTGVSSQEISPLVTIWFTHAWVTIVCGVYLFYKDEFKKLWQDFKNQPKTILGQSIFDNLAWISFGYATTAIPISIATSISESYIAFAAILGVLINKEKLRGHQVVGVILAIVSIIALAAISS